MQGKTNVIRILAGAALGAAVLAAALPAAAQTPREEWATVLSVTPVYQRINQPRQECWTEVVTTTEYRRAYAEPPVGALLGSIAGGVIGHQFGSGRGRDVATVAGALTGAAIGNGADGYYGRGGYVPVTREVQRCRNVDQVSDVVQGYDVRYAYDGREYFTRLSYDPGDRLPVRVDVAPQYR